MLEKFANHSSFSKFEMAASAILVFVKNTILRIITESTLLVLSQDQIWWQFLEIQDGGVRHISFHKKSIFYNLYW